jgi:iron complex transport system substrate-binding protein
LVWDAAAGGAAPPRRVVSLLPSHTEIVVSLGAGSRLAGVSDAEKDGDFPGVPRVGGLQPNWEALVSLQPDIVLADISHQRFEKTFQRFRLPVVYLPSTKAGSFEDVFGLVQDVGRRVGESDRAEKLVRDLRQKLQAAESRIPAGRRPRVYFEIWPRPLQAAGPRSLQGHLISRARGENIVPASRNEMPLISMEWVPQQAPQVILHTGVEKDQDVVRRPGWSAIPAVRTARVYQVDRDLFSRAGPGLVEAFERLVELLYGSEP